MHAGEPITLGWTFFARGTIAPGWKLFVHLDGPSKTFVNADPVDVNTMREPTPVKVDPSTWFLPLSDPSGGMIQFERQEHSDLS